MNEPNETLEIISEAFEAIHVAFRSVNFRLDVLSKKIEEALAPTEPRRTDTPHRCPDEWRTE